MLIDSTKEQEKQGAGTMTGGTNILVTLALVGAGIFAVSKFAKR
jgi:predicted transporter